MNDAMKWLDKAAALLKKKRLSADEKEYAAHAIDRARELLTAAQNR